MTPRIESAEYLESYKIRLTFSDGKIRTIDLDGELWGEMFEPLRNLEIFRQFKVNQELRTIVWPNGADLAPEFLYEAAAPSL